MTMKEIARLAGVSVSTVSKAFSGSPEISSEKREYIFKIARENRCYDKYCKTAYKKPVIAVLCPEYKGRHYSQELDFFEKEIKERGGVMIAGSFGFDEEMKRELLAYFAENVKVSGIIIISSIPKNISCSIPVVSIGKGENDTISLSLDNSINRAVEYLVENGHRDIAYIGEGHTKTKREQVISAMKNNGIEVKCEYIMESCERFEQAGYNEMNTLLSLKKPPTAVFTAYDSIAAGAVKSIYEHGLKIPDDISVIGGNDESMELFLNVGLTSVSVFHKELCEIIVDVLFERIQNGENKSTKKIRLSTELIKRNSVGKRKNL